MCDGGAKKIMTVGMNLAHEMKGWRTETENASLADADDDSLSSGLQFVSWRVMTTPIISIMTEVILRFHK